MEISMIPDNILDDLASRGMTAEQIESSTPEHLFDEYLQWHGLQGYTSSFLDAIDSLRAAKKAN